MLTLHATLSLCGIGHHALDTVFASAEDHAAVEGQAGLQPPAGDCAVCDLLSLPVLPVAFERLVMREIVASSDVLLIEAVSPPSPGRPAAPPRAPPRASA